MSVNKMKMIVTDLDGTLLRNDKTISAFTKETIHRLRERGVLFAIATARPIRSVKEFLPDLPYDIGIFHNGAVTVDECRQVTNVGIRHPQQVILDILKENSEYPVAVEVDDRLYSNFDAGRIWSNIVYTATSDFQEIREHVADKIIIETNSMEEIESLQKKLPSDLYIQMCENTVALIMNKNATKLEAIKSVIRQKGISLEEVIAFGDDYNDLEMIQHCGIGVAMENALDVVKQGADAVALSNEEDGVARWLEENKELYLQNAIDECK